MRKLLLLVLVCTLLPASARAAIAIDKTVSKDQGSPANTVATSAFSTISANELLLAFISTDATSSGTNIVVNSMTTAGLTWTLVGRTNAQRGTAEVWRALAPAVLTNVTVSASLSQSAASSLTVIAFTGVDTTGTNGSGAIGAVASGNKSSGAPTVSLVTTRNNSWVFGVGNDWDKAIARTPSAGQTIVHAYLAPVGDTYWVQELNAATPTSGTTVTLSDTAPTGDRYNLTAVEVRAPATTTTTITPSAGTPQSTVVNTAFGTTLQATVKDASNNPVVGTTVTFAVPASGASGTFAGGSSTAVTNSSGVATAAALTANTIAGAYTVTASASGVASAANFLLTNIAGSPAAVAASAGATQSATINAPFATNLQVTVKDSFGNAVSGALVTFSAPASGATGSFAGGVNTATTNASGVATAVQFTANGVTGSYAVTAAVSGATTASFNLTNISAPPASISATAGSSQTAMINSAFTSNLQATVRDASSNPVSGVTVTFSAPGAGASGTFSGGNTAVTNSSGVATAGIFTANSTAGSYSVSASVSGVGSPATFSLTNAPGAAATVAATAGTPQSATVGTAFATNLQVAVKDAGNNGVPGVIVTFAAPPSGASGAFAGGVSTATTNSSGIGTAPVFTANAVAGAYAVTATVAGLTPASFNLANNPPAGSGIKLLQTNATGNETGTSSMSLAFTSNNTAGDFLIVTGTAARPASTITVSDTLGNSYLTALGPVTDSTQNVTMYVWYVPVCKGGSNTVTITPSGTAALEIHVSEWSGLATTSPVDKTSTATGTGPTVSSGAVTPSINGELVFGYGWVANTASAGAGFTPLWQINGDLDEYQIQPTAGSIAATFTQTSGTWLAAVVAFKPVNWSISGTVNGAPGATVTLNGPAGGVTTADGSGNYSFAGLPAGNYTVTPTMANATFNPASDSVLITNANVTGVNFAVVTYTISGVITGPTGTTVTLSGAASASTTSNASGNYSFAGLLNGSYTITPSKAGFAFNPASQIVTVSGANATSTNFNVVTYSISGNISGGAGASVALSGASSASTTADSSGNYTFSGLLNGSYAVTPAKAGFTFSPASQPVTISGASVAGTNFAALFSISGTITGGSGATVTLSGDASAVTSADSGGNYIFTGLLAGNYTVTPTKANATFNPANVAVSLTNAGATGVNFAAVTYTISGVISGPAGATVTLSGAASAVTTSDASGNYTFSGLLNGDYTVTPSKAGFAFNPPNQLVTLSGANVTAINFTAPTYAISGTVTGGAGATMTLTGSASATTIADTSGNFSFTGLGNGSYTVTPTKSGYSFTPASQSATINSADVQGINFSTSALPTLAIDATAFGDAKSSATSVTTAAFSTTSANEVLLAFVGADVSTASGTNNTISGITGGGLTWVLVRRNNTQRGTAEIWSAFATTTLSSVTVKANLSISAVSSITVMSFKGANTSGTNGSGAIGATASGSGTTGTPTASLQTTANNSLVIGIGEDWNAAPTVTPGANQTMVHLLSLSGLNTFWVQRQSALIPAAGTAVTINDTAPTAHIYNLTICEVLGATSGGLPPTYSISGVISPTTGGAGATVALSGAASASTAAGSDGSYSFPGLANGTYTLTPSNAGYSFSPTSQTVTVNNANIAGANFTASAQGPTYTISGTVTSSGSGAQIALGGTATNTATADSLGNYSFNGLPAGSYSVTPSKSGIAFSPTTQQVTITSASVSNINFTAATLSVTVTVSPIAATLLTSKTQQFTATVTGAANTSVTWSVTAGSISSGGLYTAPNSVGTYTVTATSVADNTKSASASVDVILPTSTSLLLGDQTVETQADATLPLGQAEAFLVNANKSGSLQSLAVYLDPTSTVTSLTAGLYADNNGHPGSLLIQGTTTQLVAGAWNPIIVPATPVVNGTNYWVALLGTNSGTLVFREGTSGGCSGEVSSQTNLTSLAASWITGAASSTCPLSVFGDSAKVVFYDTFAGTQISPMWTVISRHGEYAQNETECNIPQQVAVNNGLTITAAAQSSSCGDSSHAATTWPYITGDVQWSTLNFTYGTVEIRAKFPSSTTSLWPATWLLGSNCQATNIVTGDTGVGSCPDLGASAYTEIDMTECIGTNWCQLNIANPSFNIGGGCNNITYHIDANYHTFTTVWNSSNITQYYDTSSVSTCNSNLNKPMFLIMQIQTGGVAGTPNNGALPASLLIEHVKVTQP